MIKLTCNPFQFKHEIHVLATTMFVTRKCLRLILWLCNVYEKNDDMSSQSCTWKPFLWSSAVIYEDDQIQFWRSLTLIPLQSVGYPEPSHNVALPAQHGQGKGTRSIFFLHGQRIDSRRAAICMCDTIRERLDRYISQSSLAWTPCLCYFPISNYFPWNKPLLKLLSI